MVNSVYLYLLAPLHTGGTTQEGNLLGIAREAHTNLPYIPSSTIRGKLRSLVSDRITRAQLFGPDLKDLKDANFLDDYKLETDRRLNQLTQGDVWVGDGSILWVPVPSLSHGMIWITCPMLLRRWARFEPKLLSKIPEGYASNLKSSNVYLKDAIIKSNELKNWPNWKDFLPTEVADIEIEKVLVLPDQHCMTLIQMSLWRQVKIKLDDSKSVDGGFRYEEAIPPDTLMYFTWGITSQAKGTTDKYDQAFKELLKTHQLLQIGGQESLGRGFCSAMLGD